MEIKHCRRCLMPNTRPNSLFDEKPLLCQACKNYEKRKEVDWEERNQKLKKLCDKYRRNDGHYDCLIPVSGGKDSHFLVYMMKKKMHMNPLLVTVGDPFTKTNAGIHNLRNINEAFGCDHIQFDISIELFKKVTRIGFEKLGEPLRFIEAVIYTIPAKFAVELKIPLVVYGENPAYEYGATTEDNYSAKGYIRSIFENIDKGFWKKEGIQEKELNAINPPCSEKEFRETEIIFMSYFDAWSSSKHLKIAKEYGFEDLAHEWKRDGCIDDYEQIDSIGYMVHHWLKYPKFGFQGASDIASRYVREGEMSIDIARKLIKERDYKLDQRALDDFINLLGYSPKEFWRIVEKFWNPNLFEKKNGIMQRKFNYE